MFGSYILQDGTNIDLVETVQSSQSPNGSWGDSSGPTYQEALLFMRAKRAEEPGENIAPPIGRKVGILSIRISSGALRAMRPKARMCVGRI